MLDLIEEKVKDEIILENSMWSTRALVLHGTVKEFMLHQRLCPDYYPGEKMGAPKSLFIHVTATAIRPAAWLFTSNTYSCVGKSHIQII